MWIGGKDRFYHGKGREKGMVGGKASAEEKEGERAKGRYRVYFGKRRGKRDSGRDRSCQEKVEEMGHRE